MADASPGWVTPDKFQPRERYEVEVERIDNGKGRWNSSRVTVFELDEPEGRRVREVGEFTYRYSIRPPFEPFRQLRDKVWHDYALVAEDYTRLSVMDLETGEIIAVEQPSDDDLKRAQEIIDKNPTYTEKGYTADDIARGWGFCPVDIYVPDFWEHCDGSIMPGNKYWDSDDEQLVGNFGVYIGCVWGDDSSWKLQYVNLSRVSEGVVTTDARFGYVPVAQRGRGRLKDTIEYYSDGGGRFVVPVEMWFNAVDGKAGRYTRDEINWSDK